jgi:DNA-binding NarL/FixJ family response regulator
MPQYPADNKEHSMAIRVILADDHPVVREGIRAVIEKKGEGIVIIGEAGDGNEALKIAKDSPADVYILDISMPVLNGIETTERIIKRDPDSKVIILSMHDDRTFIERALRLGARGYVLKETATDEIVHAINEVYTGRYFLSSRISTFIVEDYLGRHHADITAYELTNRERGILQLIAEGCSNKDIAVKLALSLHTVHVHRNNIMKKLRIHKQADLIRYALKEGLVQL